MTSSSVTVTRTTSIVCAYRVLLLTKLSLDLGTRLLGSGIVSKYGIQVVALDISMAGHDVLNFNKQPQIHSRTLRYFYLTRQVSRYQ